MTRPAPLALLWLAALTAATPALAQTVMKPGGWEMTTGSILRAQISNHAELDRLTTRMVQDVERPGGSKGRVTMAGEGRYVGDCTEDMTKPTPPVRPKS